LPRFSGDVYTCVVGAKSWQLRTQRTHIIVYAGGYFEIFETLRFVQMVLQLSSPVQEQLRTWVSEHFNQIQKRE